jgi:hypothetical protein
MIDGNINYIGATDSNNGITAKISNNKYIHPANTITISYNGSIAEAFYQSKPFWATDDVNVLYPKFSLTQNIALFLCTIIHKEKYRFNYGRKWDKEMMQQSKIKLPVNYGNNPNWQWIEDYVKNTLVPKLPQKAKLIWNKTFDKKAISDTKISLKIENWKYFKYNELFQITGSKTTSKTNLKEYGIGKYPYITTQAVNNGTEDFFDFFTEKGGVFTVDSAVLGFCSYQEKKFSASDHVEKLIPLFDCNIYIAMFLTTIINKEQYRYNYGRKCSQDKLKQSKIKLPITKDDTPDWQFMENYIKSLPYSKSI